MFYLVLFAFVIGCKEEGAGGRRTASGDTTAPSAPVVSAVSPIGPANNNLPVITGTAEADSTIWLYSNSLCTALVGSGGTDGAGNFSATATLPDDSTTNIYARAGDAAGNASACSATFVTYTEVTAPLARPVLISSTPTGPSTNNNPSINGTAVAGQTVTLYSNATCTSATLGSAVVGGGGTFSIPITVANNTTRTIYAKATLATDYSACSTTSVTYVEDSTAPSLPNISGMSPASPANNNSPSILGTAEANATINLYSDAACTSALGTGTVNGTGFFSVSIAVANNTTTAVYGKAIDGAGNSSPCTTTLTDYVEDSTAPGPPTVSGSNPSSPANNNTPLINGSTDPNAVVALYSDSSCSQYLATGTADGSGNFGISIGAADDSSTTVYARAVDPSGNISTCSVSFYTYIESSASATAPIMVSSAPSGTANFNSPAISGIASAGANVELFSNNSCTTSLATGVADGSGNFTIAIAVANNSTTTVYGRAEVSGIYSPCSTTFVNYNEDSAAPGLPVVSSSVPAGPANNNNPVISGTAEANSAVALYSNNTCSTLLATGTANGSGTYSISIAVANDTTTTVYAKATDAASNASACSTTFVSYQELSTVVAVPAVVSSSPVSPSSNNTTTITGTAEAGRSIQLFSNNSCATLIASGTADGSGNFSIPITVGANTTTTVYAKANNGSGIYSSCSTTFVSYVEDSTAPALPMVASTSPVGPANNNSPLINGTTEANASISLYSNNTCSSLLASGSANGSGNFSISISVVDDTTTSVYAKATDGAGNVSGCSTTFVSYQELSTAVNEPVVVSSSPAGPSNSNTTSIIGTAQAGRNIELFSNNTCATLIASGTADGSGNFSISITVGANTTTTVYAKANNGSGVYSPCSTTFVTYIEDSSAPALPVVSSASPAGPANNNSPSISGTTEASAFVSLYSNNTCTTSLASGSANGSGNFSISISVSDDSTTTVYAKAADAAGNLSGCSTTFVSYQELSTVLSAPVVSSASPAGPANNNAPVISGTADPSRNVDLFSNNTCTTQIASGTSNGSGNFSIAIAPANNTTTTVYAKSNNGAGIYSPCSTTFVTYVEDSTAPALPVVGSSSPAGPANNNSPTISGTSEASATINLYSNNTCTTSITSGSSNGSGNFSIAITVADDSSTTVYAKATDAAGNASGCSTSFVTYQELSTVLSAPVVSSASPAGPANNNAPVISGTADPSRNIELFSNNTCATLLASGTSNGSGNFSIAIAPANNTTTTVYAKSNTGTGIYSPCSTTFVTYVEDSTAPALPVVSSSSPVGPANNNAPTISGTAEASAAVQLFSNNTCTTSLATGAANGSGNFAIAIAVTDDTTTTVYAKATDSAGNTSGCSSTSVSYVETSLALAQPVLTAASPAGPANNNNPVISGTADPSRNIELFSNNTCTTLLASGASNGSGAFSIAIAVANNSSTTVYAKSNNGSGVYSSCSTSFVTYVEDSTAPGLPVVSSSSPTGPANNNAPTISGTAEASASVQLFSNNTCTTSLATGAANGSGNFAIAIAVTDDTTTTVYAKATDAAGNASSCSTTFVSYQELSTVLSAPVVSSASPAGPANNNAPVISGSADPSRNIELFSNNACTTLLASGTSNGSGSFSIAIAPADNTTTTVYAKSNTGTGIYSPCSTTFATYVEDSAAPALPVVSSSSPASPANNNAPNISGTAEANASIQLFSDNTCTTSLASGTASAGGAFTIAIAVTGDATTSVYAKATDSAGNVSGCSTTFLSYVEDSTAPAVPTMSSSSPATRSSKTNVNFIGTAEGSSTVKVYSNSGCTTLVGTGAAAAGGAFTVASTVGLDVVLSYYGTATDAAGNVSSCSATSVSYEAYSIPIGIGNFTAIQTNAGATPTNINQTLASFQWNNSDYDFDFYGHSTTTSSHQITVKQAGDYQLSLTVPVTSAVAGATVTTEVSVNGTARSNGRSQTSYIVTANGQVEASANPTIYLAGLAANDVIDITTTQEAAAGALNISGKVSLYIENIASSRTIFFATATRTVSSTNLNGAAASSLQWTDSVKDIGFTHSNSVSTENISIDAIGTYIVHVNIPLSGAVTSANVQAQVQLGGTTVTGGFASQGFISNVGGNTSSSVHWSGVVRTVSTSQVLTIKTIAEAAAGTLTVPAGREASISVEKLSGTSDMFYGNGTTLVGGVTNYNATTATAIQYTSAPIKDTLVYTHSTATNSQEVTVNTAGDYLLILNSNHLGTAQRQNQVVEVLVNGVALSGAQTKSFFINGTPHFDVSGSLVFYLRKLTASQKVTVTTFKEGANGTTTTGNTSLILLRKPY